MPGMAPNASGPESRTPAPADLGTLQPQQWAKLQSLADQFETAWRSADTAQIESFLPPPGEPLRTAALHELVRTDLENRWKRRQEIALEEYLKKYPELGTPETLAPQLIFEEYRARQLHGDRPALETYRSRFPSQFPQLEQMARTQPLAAGESGATDAIGTVVGVAMAATVGSTLLQVGEGYQLIRRIGSGSFAEVHLAKAPGGVDVAVKCIIQPIDKEEAQRELASLELTKQLRHPYLLQTQAFGFRNERLYIVMELADGSLRDRFKKCREEGLTGIPVAELLTYFREAAEAIDFLHRNPLQKVVHRDIKPENILVLAGHAKVADFGLARVLQTQRMSVSGGAGTPRYMAPEVWDNRIHKVGERSDQYSLAVTYAELRLGRAPFTGSDMASLMRAALNEEPNLDGLPEAEQKVIRRALAKVPGNRYSSCTEFVQNLEQAVGVAAKPHTDGDPYQTVVGVRLPPPTRGRKLLPSILVAVIVLAATLGVLLWKQQQQGAAFELVAPHSQEIKAGGVAHFTVHVQRGKRQGTPEVTVLSNDSANKITVRVEPSSDSADEVGVRVAAAPDARSGTLRLQAKLGDDTTEAAIDLEIKGTAYFLPTGWQPCTDAQRLPEIGDRVYYDRIEVSNNKFKIPVRFVFIPGNLHNRHNAPFYISECKISTEQFGTARPEWDRKYPVTQVTALAAHQYAVELIGQGHGFLPTVDQWDIASGRYAPDHGDGPFRKGWNEKAPPGIWINRNGQNPAQCGVSEDDISLLGVRDMAGNGYEWTRDAYKGSNNFPVQEIPATGGDYDVQLRGESWERARPLFFKDFDDEKLKPGMQPYNKLGNDIGFRVVIEVEQ